jgi:transposase InsO family protein
MSRSSAGSSAAPVGACAAAASTTPAATPTQPVACAARPGVLADEKATTAVGFLKRAVAFYRRYGIRVEAILSDNGSAYRAAAHAIACHRLRIKHLRSRPYRPQTNGKAERFIRTMLNAWAYGAIYRSSSERTAALDGWLWHYNHRRRHSALGHRPPLSRTNVFGSYS